MSIHTRKSSHPARAACRSTRLAESAVVTIDACDCGVLQLHFGAVTLRLAPCAAAEVLATLERALSEDEARRIVRELSERDAPYGAPRRGRGDA